MGRSNISSACSVGAAIAASLCCVWPIIAALTGFGTIGAFAFLDDYRSYFLILTILLLGFSFYMVYRKREVDCDDGTCRIETGSKGSRTAVWLAAVLATTGVAFPYFGESMLASSPPPSQQVSSAKSITLEVEGMDCEMCARGLEALIGQAEGVHSAVVSFEERKTSIRYDSTIIQTDSIISAVESAGFFVKRETETKKDEPMKDQDNPIIEFLYFNECPNHQKARALLEEVLHEEDIEGPINKIRVETEEEAHIHRFVGSPTIRFNGRDIDPGLTDGPYSVVCRVYQVNGRIVGTPTKDMIRKALVTGTDN